MRCEICRELVSADLDGELTPVEQRAMQAHISGCRDCTAFGERAADLHRAARVTAADQVPDLTDAIMAAHPSRPSKERTRDVAAFADFLRYALGAVAVTQLVLAVPELFRRSGSEQVHNAHHLGGWDLAFAVGLLVVALQPWRARGLLPMAGALAGVMIITAVIDLAGGNAVGMAESTHLLEITGVLLLWQLARTQPSGRTPFRRDRGSGDGPPSTEPLRPRRWIEPGSSGPATACAPDREQQPRRAA